MYKDIFCPQTIPLDKCLFLFSWDFWLSFLLCFIFLFQSPYSKIIHSSNCRFRTTTAHPNRSKKLAADCLEISFSFPKEMG